MDIDIQGTAPRRSPSVCCGYADQIVGAEAAIPVAKACGACSVVLW